MTARLAVLLLFALFAWPGWPPAADAAQCQDPAGFPAWLDSIRRDAARQGVSPRALAALDGLTPNPQVLSLDRNQKAFRMSFEAFAASRITAARLSRGAALLGTHRQLVSAIEGRYGVPGAVLVAIWGLETDFGANTGNMSSLRSLATLAHDCRRTDLFQGELISALMIIDRGDLAAGEMVGAWAGELGQTQFLASNYLRYAVDFDGDGRRNLIRSVPDALASTANYLRAYGWRPGAGWQPGEANFAAIKGWNKSDIYARTIALFAARLAGA
jgi:lytic murein transglycosylase